MSLRDPASKMSKSHLDPSSRILITESAEDIHKKIRGALTDGINGLSYDPENRPGVSALIDLVFYLNAGLISRQDIVKDNENLSMRAFKEKLATLINETIEPVREKFEQLMSDGGKQIDVVLAEGAIRARESASETMKRVRAAVGIN
jgi:tryptophanyl-tRNA synthetase